MPMALSEELEAELQLCKDLRILEPTIEVSHHGQGCGCPYTINEETGLFTRWSRRGDVIYDTDYPFFICAWCRNLVPWCFGAAHENSYLNECCDRCRCELTKGET